MKLASDNGLNLIGPLKQIATKWFIMILILLLGQMDIIS